MDNDENKGDHDDQNHGDVESQEPVDGKEIWRYCSEASASTQSQPFLVKRANTTSQIAIVGSNVYSIESLDYE